MRDKRISRPTPTSVSGKITLLTMSTMSWLPKNSFMKILLRQLFTLFLRGTIQLFWPMDKQEQEKLTQWKDLSIVLEIQRGVLCREVWRKSLNSFKCNLIKILLSWLGLLTYKYTMK